VSLRRTLNRCGEGLAKGSRGWLPVVIAQEKSKPLCAQMGMSLFNRLYKAEVSATRFTLQFRYPPQICKMISSIFYNGSLRVASAAVERDYSAVWDVLEFDWTTRSSAQSYREELKAQHTYARSDKHKMIRCPGNFRHARILCFGGDLVVSDLSQDARRRSRVY